jgi:Flp pilus assembly protein TadD
MVPKSSPPLNERLMKSEAVAKNMEMGRFYHNLGQYKFAEACYRRALALGSKNAEALHMLGVLAIQSHMFDDAIRLIKSAARKSPDDPNIYVNLGSAYHKANRKSLARESYETALILRPNFAEAHFNLGKLLSELKEWGLAIECFNKSLELSPNDPAAYLGLGNVYKHMGDRDRAEVNYEEAIRLSPQMPEAYGNLAAVYVDRGNHKEAFALATRAIALDPQSAELRLKRAIIALRLGNFEVGWADWEARFKADDERVTKYPTPPAYWSGEELAEKTILVWTEQGLGEEILYGSMIAEIAARARRCIVECSPRMVPVFARAFPKVTVRNYNGPRVCRPSEDAIDLQISIGSAGRFLRLRFEDFPSHKGYLKADMVRTAALRKHYRSVAPNNVVVGISWRSNNARIGRQKGADLVTWTEILKVSGVTFVNLQYGDCGAEITEVKKRLGVDIVCDPSVDPLRSIDDFFAQVAAVDLVITTSNTTAHVAGSLNIPTRLLINDQGGGLWYWFLGRADSPWYPSIRIFRHTVEDHPTSEHWWIDLAARIGEELTLIGATQMAVTS